MFFKVLFSLVSLFLMILFSILFLHNIKTLKEHHLKAKLNAVTIKLLFVLSRLYRNYPSLIINLSKFNKLNVLSDKALKNIVYKASLGYEGKNSLSGTLLSVEHHPYIASLLYDIIEETSKNNVFDNITEIFQFSTVSLKLRGFLTLVMSGITLAPIPLMLLMLFYQQDMLLFLPFIVALFYGAILCLAFLTMKRLARTFV